jgi:pimeloyl-ACP methyl ester carboxylesterase
MGGMIDQEYAVNYGSDLRSVTFGCTYAAPGPFCSRMFAMWQDLAPVMGVGFVMRDVTLWSFTTSFFAERPDEAAELERAMRYLDQPVPAYLSQLAAIQDHDTRAELPALSVPTLVLAGEEDILIPVPLSRELQQLVPDSVWATTPGGHACMWEHPQQFNRVLIGFLDGQR